MILETINRNLIDLTEWDRAVFETYGKPYSLQEQDGGMSRGTIEFAIPTDDVPEDFENSSIPETVNGDEMGVTFEAWLARDEDKTIQSEETGETWRTNMWWERNFYPNHTMIVNDMFAKGLIEAGKYTIVIDW